MKLLLKTSFTCLFVVFAQASFVSARTINSSTYDYDTRINTPTRLSRNSSEYLKKYEEAYDKLVIESPEYTENDCITKYIEALDKECYNSANVNQGGVYSDCNDKTMTELYDVMDMQLARIVGLNDFGDVKEKCEIYKGNALTNWLSAKEIVEQSALKGSSECILANKKLTAAKKCYSAAIAHDGNSFEFEDLMILTCGDFPDVANKFSDAGDLGLANIPQLLENYSTLQFTKKSENWRQSVEAILAGYTYDAKQACGEETYEILQLNQFTTDSRENLLTLTADSFAEEFGSNLGSRAYETIKPDNLSSNAYKGIYQGIQSSPYARTTDKNSSEDEEEKAEPLLINEIYVIEGISSVNNTRARLSNILLTGDVGTPDSQDDIDRAIIMALGGRADGSDTIIYNTIAKLQQGDSFVIKQTNNTCQVLMLDDDYNLMKVSSVSVNSNNSLLNYVYDCERIVE